MRTLLYKATASGSQGSPQNRTGGIVVPSCRTAKWRRLVGVLRAGCAWLGSLASYRRRPGLADWRLCSGESRIVRLRPHELIRLTRHSLVARIEVIRGTLWVTETPANGDLLLVRGDQICPTDGWPIVVEATEETEILLRHRVQGRQEQAGP